MLAFKKPGEFSMHVDQFEMRVARVRHRFAAALEDKIRNTMVAADHISRGDDDAIKCISESYRSLHGICGVGATVGFAATGEAAHAAETTLIQAYHEKRSLTERELLGLKRALEALRTAAATELRLMDQRGG